MKRLLIISGKGGTGKTTLSAAFIALSGAKAVADCDVDAPNLHLVMQQTAQPETSQFFGGDKATIDAARCIGCGACAAHCRFGAIQLTDGAAHINAFACEGCGVCAHVCPVGAAALLPDVAGTRTLYRGDAVFSTATLKMGRGNSGKLVTDVKRALFDAAPPCDLAIIDGSPGIGCPVIASMNGVDLVLIVTEPSHSGMSDLKRLVQTINATDTACAVCINRCESNDARAAELEAFCVANHLTFVGAIPFDPAAVDAVNAGHSIADLDSPAGIATRTVFQAVLTALSSITNKGEAT